jgi:hypothetical protein
VICKVQKISKLGVFQQPASNFAAVERLPWVVAMAFKINSFSCRAKDPDGVACP